MRVLEITRIIVIRFQVIGIESSSRNSHEAIHRQIFPKRGKLIQKVEHNSQSSSTK
jgi:hypothetical protein